MSFSDVIYVSMYLFCLTPQFKTLISINIIFKCFHCMYQDVCHIFLFTITKKYSYNYTNITYIIMKQWNRNLTQEVVDVWLNVLLMTTYCHLVLNKANADDAHTVCVIIVCFHKNSPNSSLAVIKWPWMSYILKFSLPITYQTMFFFTA